MINVKNTNNKQSKLHKRKRDSDENRNKKAKDNSTTSTALSKKRKLFEKEQDVEEKDNEQQKEQLRQQNEDEEISEQELGPNDENNPDKLLGFHPFSSYKHPSPSSKSSDFFTDYMKGYINEEILNPAGYKQSVSKYMKDYDLRVNKEEQVMEKLRGVPDDEGWIKVFPKKGKKFTSPLTLTDVLNINSQMVETDRDKTRAEYERLVPFYRHQKEEARKEELEFIQKKFEQDKNKILEMKSKRNFE